MIALGAAALAAAGLASPTIDLGHLGLAREVLAALALPDGATEEVRGRIAKRDGAGLDERAASRGARGVRFAARCRASGAAVLQPHAAPRRIRAL